MPGIPTPISRLRSRSRVPLDKGRVDRRRLTPRNHRIALALLLAKARRSHFRAPACSVLFHGRRFCFGILIRMTANALLLDPYWLALLGLKPRFPGRLSRIYVRRDRLGTRLVDTTTSEKERLKNIAFA